MSSSANTPLFQLVPEKLRPPPVKGLLSRGLEIAHSSNSLPSTFFKPAFQMAHLLFNLGVVDFEEISQLQARLIVLIDKDDLPVQRRKQHCQIDVLEKSRKSPPAFRNFSSGVQKKRRKSLARWRCRSVDLSWLSMPGIIHFQGEAFSKTHRHRSTSRYFSGRLLYSGRAIIFWNRSETKSSPHRTKHVPNCLPDPRKKFRDFTSRQHHPAQHHHFYPSGFSVLVHKSPRSKSEIILLYKN